ncbi:MAG: CapA family protein [Bacilli bacterium]|nr:CapA family protein [Bacilli bacterium]
MRRCKFGKLILFIFIFVLSLFFIELKEKKKPINYKNVKKVVEVKPKHSRLSLVMVGDALLHSSVYNDAYTGSGYDFSKQLDYIRPIVKKYDLAFYNQESILGGTDIGLSDYPCFNSPQEFGDEMLSMGFNLISLANNHTLDKGVNGVSHACDYWSKHKDVLWAGSYCSQNDADEIKIKEKNGIKYTMLAYTYGTNGIKIPDGKDYLVNLYSDEKAKQDILKVRDKTDLLIVSMHWGTEYRSVPTEEQKRQALYLSNLGVDIIIGTHPHVVEPIDYVNNTLVIYSLGNFISAQSTNSDYNTMVELMSSVDIVKTVKNGKSSIKLENLNNELLYNYYKKSSKWYDFKVIPFSQMTSSFNNDYQRLYTKYSDIVRMYDKNIRINNVN